MAENSNDNTTKTTLSTGSKAKAPLFGQSPIHIPTRPLFGANYANPKAPEGSDAYLGNYPMGVGFKTETGVIIGALYDSEQHRRSAPARLWHALTDRLAGIRRDSKFPAFVYHRGRRLFDYEGIPSDQPITIKLTHYNAGLGDNRRGPHEIFHTHGWKCKKGDGKIVEGGEGGFVSHVFEGEITEEQLVIGETLTDLSMLEQILGEDYVEPTGLQRYVAVREIVELTHKAGETYHFRSPNAHRLTHATLGAVTKMITEGANGDWGYTALLRKPGEVPELGGMGIALYRSQTDELFRQAPGPSFGERYKANNLHLNLPDLSHLKVEEI